MGELFTSFDDAWSYFLRREEPLETFYDDFPEDEDSLLAGWVVEPAPEVKKRAAALQAALSHLEWVVPVPGHFLHVWIGLVDRIDTGWTRWPEIEAFSISYARVNCFHSAVIVEVEGPVRWLVEGTSNDVPAYLPHMTIAITRDARPAKDIREALLPLRGISLGTQIVREVKLVEFPAARSTLLRPWTLQQIVALA